MKPITFTRHAPIRIVERGLRLDWIERAVRTPDWKEAEPADPTVERRFAVITEMEGRILRVVVRETPVAICVISAHFDRGATRRDARQHL